ncbi:hypothetical protein Lal_00035081 [Lupinus albus]|nr:hypothetical protein Lal_00035081 [Lupinus albus]
MKIHLDHSHRPNPVKTLLLEHKSDFFWRSGNSAQCYSLSSSSLMCLLFVLFTKFKVPFFGEDAFPSVRFIGLIEIRCVTLSMRDIQSFNNALLRKWNCRLLTERDILWCKVLFSKYGHNPNNPIGVGFRSSLAKLSPWARDLVFSSSWESILVTWFKDGLVRRVGDEANTIIVVGVGIQVSKRPNMQVVN